MVTTIMLGTFVVAFMASLKDDPLEQPFTFNFAQVQPKNLVAAWSLGQQGNKAPFFGSFAPKSEIIFSVTYAAETANLLTTPQVNIPRRRIGTGASSTIERAFAADYAEISELKQIDEASNVTYQVKKGMKTEELKGESATWQFTVRYQEDGPIIDTLPLSPSERGIGMVFQSYALYPHMTAFDNLAFGLKLAKRSKAEIIAAVNQVADILELQPLLKRKPSQLSGGQRQRVAIG